VPLEIGNEEALETGKIAREHRSYSSDVEQAMRLVNDCNVSIYAVDARGLAPPRGMTAEGDSFPIISQGGLGGPVVFSPGPRFIDTLQTISDRTGGKAFYGTNDLKSAVLSAMNDAQASYTLGFYSHSLRAANSFHTIKVTTSSSGTRLRYRAGFYDHGDSAPQSQSHWEARLSAALTSPVDATEIPLDVRIRTATRNPASLDLAIRVDTSGITLEQDKDRWKGHLDVVAAEKDGKGAATNTEHQVVGFNLTKKAHDSIVRDHAAVLFKTVSPRAATSTLRILVCDRVTGRVGSITYSIHP
jgi:hypothetical protein